MDRITQTTASSAALICAAAMAVASTARADYAYTTVDYPGVDYAAGGSTTIYGINSDGSAVGNAQINLTSPTIPFRYDIKRHLFIPLAPYSSTATSYTLPSGINDRGTIVGGESQDNGNTEFSYIYKDGAYTLLARPGSANFTEARAVNDHGLVSGYALNDADGTYSGFIYDARRNEWTDVLPSLVTIAQGLNNRDQLVGSVYENAGVVCTACPENPYGFVRHPDGSTAIFWINGGSTDARGINDTGTVTGWYHSNNVYTSYVMAAPKRAGFYTLTLSTRDLIRVPGAAGTFAEAIDNEGTLAGIWLDSSGAQHAFIATRH